MSRLKDWDSILNDPNLVRVQASPERFNDGADEFGRTPLARQHQNDSNSARTVLPGFKSGGDPSFEAERQGILRKRAGGMSLPEGYRFDVPHETAKDVWVYDKDGQISEAGSLQRNYGEVERATRAGPNDPNALGNLNRWRGALGMPHLNPGDVWAGPKTAQSAPAKARDWDSELQGGAAPVGAASQARAANPNAEPDAPRWIDRRMQDVRGKSDPRYKNLPNIASVIQQRGQSWGDFGGETASWLMGASDKDMGKTYQSMLGRDYVRTETDANDYPVVVYRDGDQEKRAYVNNPGLDTQDVLRGAYGALPFAKVGAMISGATKALPFIGRGGAQTVGQAGTSIAQDAAAVATGVSELDATQSAVKAGIAGAGGFAGEAISSAAAPIIRRYITEPSLYNKATGRLTEKGAAAARAAGVEPDDLTQELAKEFAKSFAKTGNADAAFRDTASKEFGVRRSTGELTGNREQLLREQQMRGGTYGTSAREQVEAFDKLQRADIEQAVRGIAAPDAPPSIAQQIAPDRKAQLRRMGKDDAGHNIRSNTEIAFETAKRAEREAWEALPGMKAAEETRALLPAHLNKQIGEFPVPPGGKAEMMEKGLDAFIAGERPAVASNWRTVDSTGDVIQFRKWMSNLARTTDDPTDRAAAGAMLRGFDDWIDDAAAAMSKTDPTGAAKLRTARGLTRELHEVFDGEKGTASASILGNVLKRADSPEQIVDAIFTGINSNTKAGSVTALNHLKRAYDTYLEPAAARMAWDDIRLAYWLKVTNSRSGDVANPAALSSAIKNGMGSQPSVFKTLYTPAEIAAMRRLSVATSEAARKNPNTSWSAVGVGALGKDMFNGILGMLGLNSSLAKTAVGTIMKPVSGTYHGAQASRATGGLQGAQLPALPIPSLGGIGGGFAASQQR